ncbi:MAG: TolC family protein [Bacteroidales bacterium]
MKALSRISILILFVVFLNNFSFSQSSDTTGFDDLLALALKNNYGILISKNDVEIGQMNNSWGNAGFLPVVGISALDNYSKTDNQTAYSDGTDETRNNINSNMLDAAIQLNWTLFDGTKMFVVKNKLSELENRSRLQLQMETEAVYVQLSSMYYGLVQEQKLEQVLIYTLGISRFRFSLADRKFRLGAASEVDRIQASLDYSNDSSLLIKEQTKIMNLKADINRIVGRAPETAFSAQSEMEILTQFSYSDLENSLNAQNISILLARNNLRIRELEMEETRSYFLPSFSLYADYGYTRFDYNPGTIDWTETMGPTVGLRLGFNLFNGFNDRRRREISKIEYESAQLEEKDQLIVTKSELYQSYNTYTSAIKQIDLETSNLENARKNLQFAVELYKRGAINEIDFREIQRKEFDAENRLLFAQYYAKTAEIQLLQISGNLKLEANN